MNKSAKTTRPCQSALETLETRRLFSVPVDLAPAVIGTEFNCEAAKHFIRVSFNKDVSASLDGGDLVLINQLSRYVVPAEGVSVAWEETTNTAIFMFDHLLSLPEGKWTATLVSEGIFDEQGLALDGDGDELPGGDYSFQFSFLVGDANHDGIVNLHDFNIAVGNLGLWGAGFSDGDFDYDGIVMRNDIEVLAANFGRRIEQSLPTETSSANTGVSSRFSSDKVRSSIEEEIVLA